MIKVAVYKRILHPTKSRLIGTVASAENEVFPSFAGREFST
jgi:hypothetical protein